MGIIKRAGDLVYTFRFLRLLTTSFEDTEAFKHGIIDKDGKRLKSFSLNTMDNRDLYRDYYTPFHRLVFNVKKLIAKAPGGGTKLASYAAALYLLKENFSVPEAKINKALSEVGIDPIDFILENTQWFVLEDKRLSPGVYKVLEDKLLLSSMEEAVKARDKVRVGEDCYPVGEIFGLDIYEVTHINTKQSVLVSVGELAR